MNVSTFRVRSIYDIPIIELLRDELGYKIVQATKEQADLFGVKENLDPYDIEISDILGGYGVSIEAEEEYVDAIMGVFVEKIPDVIVMQHPIQIHATYNGRIVHVNYDKKLCIVDIGESITAIMFDKQFRRGEKVVVQIKQLNILQDKLPICSPIIHFPGQFVILERDTNFVRVSRKLPKEERDRLFELGKELRPRNHGLIMRTSAATAEETEIQTDIERLVQQSQELDFIISGSSYGPGILQPGDTVGHVLFVKEAKEKLDKIRNDITPTIPNYHWFMSYSPQLKLTTNFAERISSEIDNNILSTLLKEVILEKDFAENSLLSIQEYRLTSPPIERIVGQISWKNKILAAKRSFRSSRGTHYALEKDISSGDTSILLTKSGSWTIHTKIIRDGNNIGEHIKLVTPVELYSDGFIRYIDLGVMLIKQEDSVKIVETDVLSSLVEQDIISKTFKQKVDAILAKCKDLLEEGEEYVIIEK